MLAKLAKWSTLLRPISLSAQLTVEAQLLSTNSTCLPISAVRGTGRNAVYVHFWLYTDDRFITAVFCHFVRFYKVNLENSMDNQWRLEIRQKSDKSDVGLCLSTQRLWWRGWFTRHHFAQQLSNPLFIWYWPTNCFRLGFLLRSDELYIYM